MMSLYPKKQINAHPAKGGERKKKKKICIFEGSYEGETLLRQAFIDSLSFFIDVNHITYLGLLGRSDNWYMTLETIELKNILNLSNVPTKSIATIAKQMVTSRHLVGREKPHTQWQYPLHKDQL